MWYYIYRSVPVEALHDKILDEFLMATDYTLPVVTTDIPVSPCPYAVITFTEHWTFVVSLTLD